MSHYDLFLPDESVTWNTHHHTTRPSWLLENDLTINCITKFNGELTPNGDQLGVIFPFTRALSRKRGEWDEYHPSHLSIGDCVSGSIQCAYRTQSKNRCYVIAGINKLIEQSEGGCGAGDPCAHSKFVSYVACQQFASDWDGHNCDLRAQWWFCWYPVVHSTAFDLSLVFNP